MSTGDKAEQVCTSDGGMQVSTDDGGVQVCTSDGRMQVCTGDEGVQLCKSDGGMQVCTGDGGVHGTADWQDHESLRDLRLTWGCSLLGLGSGG